MRVRPPAQPGHRPGYFSPCTSTRPSKLSLPELLLPGASLPLLAGWPSAPLHPVLGFGGCSVLRVVSPSLSFLLGPQRDRCVSGQHPYLQLTVVLSEGACITACA